jgi:translation elongation factor EF-1alpha
VYFPLSNNRHELLLEEDEAGELGKKTINVGVFGHIDSGKSTLLGHLFHLVDEVGDRQMDKYAKEAKKMGKGKFKFAWVFDQMEDERERGITIDTNERIIEFPDKRINFVDTPGHLDFIFNMMRGASQVDLAILLIGKAFI